MIQIDQAARLPPFKEWRRLCGLFCSMYVVRGFVERVDTDKPKER